MEDYTARFAIGGGLDVNGFRESLSMQMKETVNRGFEVYFAERAGISGFCRPVEMEGVSLLENAGHLGLPIPQKVKEVLEQLHDRSEKGDGE